MFFGYFWPTYLHKNLTSYFWGSYRFSLHIWIHLVKIRPKYVNYTLYYVKNWWIEHFESNMLISIFFLTSFFRLTITSIWMFAFVPTSPITNKKKRNEISDQYLNHVNNIIFGLKKVWKKIRLFTHRVQNQAFTLYYEWNWHLHILVFVILVKTSARSLEMKWNNIFWIY